MKLRIESVETNWYFESEWWENTRGGGRGYWRFGFICIMNITSLRRGMYRKFFFGAKVAPFFDCFKKITEFLSQKWGLKRLIYEGEKGTILNWHCLRISVKFCCHWEKFGKAWMFCVKPNTRRGITNEKRINCNYSIANRSIFSTDKLCLG